MTDSPNRGVSRRSFLASTGAVGALALAGCTEGPSSGGSGDGGGSSGDSGSSGLSGEINITGSSTVYPVATAVANRFQQEHSGIDISVSSTGSGGGFSNHFCVGNSDFNNASRPITEEEKQLCSDNDIEYHEVNVATDALTVIVNDENDWVDCMTPEQLRQIWRADGASNWSDVKSEWPDEPISRFGAADTSGTFDYFKEAILGEEANHTSNYEATEQDNLILQGVQSDQYGIGYFGFAYYQGNKSAVKALGIDNGSGCVKPSLETAKAGEYKPLSRPLFTYPRKSALAEEHIAEFARYYVEQSANSSLIADEIGYVPKTEEAMQEELDALNEVIDEAQ
ncbi:phosphate ABC transporter substrate-binding protein PstS family protein [Halomicroarcula sp. F13]|uniref:Phosphate ABC transporter substrate-binding protein PstS family protein n=1 Tax=Haloarcula rubra TaxID=2487747 RepID=A0AAW4PTL4_9EURY|nr:phosphate ABC transporter substrate-binding protein PstS family protein [Halomicroarcula rubra]MBX0324469.1 phosphate ABC transporter substrate-binding protein PstS family protein [Halomicroarcula rubra]